MREIRSCLAALPFSQVASTIDALDRLMVANFDDIPEEEGDAEEDVMELARLQDERRVRGQDPEGQVPRKRINSRRKGAAGERELAAFLTLHGFEARRGQQCSGFPDSPDVVCRSLEGLGYHPACKRVERFNPCDAIEQAADDAGEDLTPVVFHRRSRKPWTGTMYAEDLLEILKTPGSMPVDTDPLEDHESAN